MRYHNPECDPDFAKENPPETVTQRDSDAAPFPTHYKITGHNIDCKCDGCDWKQRYADKAEVSDDYLRRLVALTTANKELQTRLESAETRLTEAREALEFIDNPIRAIHLEAEAEGNKLDGMMAIEISKDHYFLRNIARQALARLEADDMKEN